MNEHSIFSHWSYVDAVPLPKIGTEILLLLQGPDQMFTPLYSLSRTLPVLPNHCRTFDVSIVHLSDGIQNLQDSCNTLLFHSKVRV